MYMLQKKKDIGQIHIYVESIIVCIGIQLDETGHIHGGCP